ncbi:hypothetical protein KEM52_003696 [Ascosphaera acerosa]|nr:hypothetical protein KEM52_003696 [Ascosphaera acerosa]
MSNGAASEESIPAHPAPPRPPRLDVLVVGNAGCGKSALISRFAGGQHRHGRAPAVGPPAEPPQRGGTDQPSLFSVRLGGRHFELAFTESSDAQSLAQSQWSRRRLASGPNVVVIAYDISDRSSLDGTREWRKEIGYQLEAGIPEADQHATPLDGQTATQTAAAASLPPAGLHLQIMLLGLKRDLRREEPGVIHPQEVSIAPTSLSYTY